MFASARNCDFWLLPKQGPPHHELGSIDLYRTARTERSAIRQCLRHIVPHQSFSPEAPDISAAIRLKCWLRLVCSRLSSTICARGPDVHHVSDHSLKARLPTPG